MANSIDINLENIKNIGDFKGTIEYKGELELPSLDDNCHIKCYWNYKGQCCPEDEKDLKNAIINNKDCPTYLRKDFEEHFWQTYDNICSLIKKRNCRELEEIEKFILSQRKDKK